MKKILNNITEINKIVSGNWLAIIFSQPILLFFLPRTYCRLFKNILNPAVFDRFVTGFSPHMAIILPWYLRIDECVKKYKRNGYVFEDGLGFSLKERFWLNPFALRLYNRLRIQKFTLIGAFLIVVSFFLIGLAEKNPIYLIFFSIALFIASPLFLIPFFRLAKPEALAWAFVMPGIYFFLSGNYFFSAFFFILLSVLNFTASLLVIESLFIATLANGNYAGFALAMLFPLLILAFNIFPFVKNSFAKGLLECLGGRNPITRSENFLRIRPHDIYLIFFYLIFISSTIWIKSSLVFSIILINSLVIFIINRNFFRFADSDTFYRMFFILSSLFLILSNFNPLVFLAYVFFIYLSPLSLMERIENVINDYPHLAPYSTKNANDFFSDFGDHIPKRARIVLESSGTEKSFDGLVELLYYLDYILFKREIEILPMEWMRVLSTDYFMKEYIKLNKQSDKETIEKKCQELGASHIMAYSTEFKSHLRFWGYKEIAILRISDVLKVFWNYEKLSEKENRDLSVFEVPFKNEIICPPTLSEFKANFIAFNANAGTEYVIKYNYHPAWMAWQNGKSLAVSKTDGKLVFLKLIPKESGFVELKFNTSWFA